MRQTRTPIHLRGIARKLAPKLTDCKPVQLVHEVNWKRFGLGQFGRLKARLGMVNHQGIEKQQHSRGHKRAPDQEGHEGQRVRPAERKDLDEESGGDQETRGADAPLNRRGAHFPGAPGLQ